MVVYSVKNFSKWSRAVNENVAKVQNERTQHTYYCQCGHSVIIRPTESKSLCHWCNNLVFKTKQDEFRYRMQEQIKRKKRGMDI